MDDISFDIFSSEDEDKKKAHKGPPNRMNDLVYRDWMKFQKSFFRHTSINALVVECINFFTKSVWSDNRPSKTLLIGIDDFPSETILSPREVVKIQVNNLEGLSGLLTSIEESYDFILVDLRKWLKNETELQTFLDTNAECLSSALRRLLIPDRYCGILVEMPFSDGKGFPTPWSLALSMRSHLRLKDEKVGLVEQENKQYYCLFFQALNEIRPTTPLSPRTLSVASTDYVVPGWTIPRPPPRKKNEILHPAKFPETLIEEFIKLFTKQGEAVFDPMVGTGSSVLAAVRTGRNGYGLDLNPEFAEIARKRVEAEYTPMLFPELNTAGKSLIVTGDAMDLSKNPLFEEISFDYIITSPPYWSMLSNPGSENQKKRRDNNLPLVYSDNTHDLGNIQDYERFLDMLVSIYDQVGDKLKPGKVITIIVKNVKREHILYPLAWDLAYRLGSKQSKFQYLGTTLWCQDDVSIKPFAVGIYWVSNILHHYCLHFTKKG